MHSALLEIIAIRLATNKDSVSEYTKKTLLYHTSTQGDMADLASHTIQELEAMKLIVVKDDHYEATLHGQAIVESSLTPEDGVRVYRELRKALGAFVLDSDMHAL